MFDLKVDKTRQYAVNIIRDVRFNSGYLNKSLQEIGDLSTKDMALLTSLTYGTIKNYDYLKTLLFQQQQNLKLKRPLEIILILALYQFIFLDKIPAYAIINSSVNLAKRQGGLFASRFVNAFLHKVFTQKEKLVLDETAYKNERAELLAVRYSMPPWLIRLLLAQYQEEQTLFFLNAIQLPAKQFIRVNRLQATLAEFTNDSHYVEQDLPYCFEHLGGNGALQAAFLEGKYSIQNIASQSVGYFLNPKKYDKILDMCAAPGGKTTHLAELTNDTAEIIALDLYEQRVAQINQNQGRLGITGIQALVADATKIKMRAEFDKVLLDAPCSGLGVLAQKPEIRYHLQPENLDELEHLQRKLLNRAWLALKPDGELTYSTCTINRNENERQVQFFLEKHPDATLVEDRLIFTEMEEGYSGFYMAKIRKQAV